MPGGHFRPGQLGFIGLYETRWRQIAGGSYFRRVGDRVAEVASLGPARWRVTEPVNPSYRSRAC